MHYQSVIFILEDAATLTLNCQTLTATRYIKMKTLANLMKLQKIEVRAKGK